MMAALWLRGFIAFMQSHHLVRNDVPSLTLPCALYVDTQILPGAPALHAASAANPEETRRCTAAKMPGCQVRAFRRPMAAMLSSQVSSMAAKAGPTNVVFCTSKNKE